jgi:hypothetical protein
MKNRKKKRGIFVAFFVGPCGWKAGFFFFTHVL